MGVGFDLVVGLVHVRRRVILHVRAVRDLVILRRKIDRAVGHVKRCIGLDSVVSRDFGPPVLADRRACTRPDGLEGLVERTERPPRRRRLRRRVRPGADGRACRRSGRLRRGGRCFRRRCRLSRRGRLGSGRASAGRLSRRCGARAVAGGRVEFRRKVRRYEAVVDILVVIVAVDVVVLDLLRVGLRVDVLAVDGDHVAVRLGIVRLVSHVCLPSECVA